MASGCWLHHHPFSCCYKLLPCWLPQRHLILQPLSSPPSGHLSVSLPPKPPQISPLGYPPKFPPCLDPMTRPLWVLCICLLPPAPTTTITSVSGAGLCVCHNPPSCSMNARTCVVPHSFQVQSQTFLSNFQKRGGESESLNGGTRTRTQLLSPRESEHWLWAPAPSWPLSLPPFPPCTSPKPPELLMHGVGGLAMQVIVHGCNPGAKMADVPKAELSEAEVRGGTTGPHSRPTVASGLWDCGRVHVWGRGGPTWEPSHSDQRLTLCACKERPPAVAQLLGDRPSWLLEGPGWLCPPTGVPGV